MSSTYEYENYDQCYECTGYGDDYYLDENNEWVSACDDCPYNERQVQRFEREDI